MKEIEAYEKVCKILGVKPAKIKGFDQPDSGDIRRDDATLVIVPDKVFEWDKIKKLAVKFGEDQPYTTYIYDKLYEQYSAEELSGAPTGESYRTVYIPKQYNVESDAAKNQAEVHRDGHVPSVLEAVCFWFTLRELGETLDFDSTYIRHFDLEAQAVGGWSHVPYSVVYGGGRPALGYAGAERDDEARLAVGSTFSLDSSSLPSSLSEESAIAYLKERGFKVSKEF